jgi:hypothetical protein
MIILQVAVFFSSQAPEFKKPESPGKAKKDYLPTSKRVDLNQFPGNLVVRSPGWRSSRPGFDSQPCCTANAVEKKRKMSFLSW